MNEKWFVAYVYGTTTGGNRNGGVGDFDTEEEARKEIVSLKDDHPDSVWMLIHGTEIARG